MKQQRPGERIYFRILRSFVKSCASLSKQSDSSNRRGLMTVVFSSEHDDVRIYKREPKEGIILWIINIDLVNSYTVSVMSLSSPLRYFVCLILSAFLVACSRGEKESDSRLGTLSFQITANPEASAHFERGLLLLHSFEFADAAEAFRDAQLADPACAMAYWGEAMTYNHPLWAEQDLNSATEVLNRLGLDAEARVEKGVTEMEKDFLRAINILYGPGSKTERDKSYSEFLGTLHKKYPDSHEVAAFYALSLMGSVPVGRDQEMFEKSARVANSILKENPRHPGALHYLIHADDDPSHAKFALAAAREYSQVAPDAGHALHMPSHIYVAMGMWDDVVSSNEASWQASVDRKEHKKLTNDALNYHGYHWLLYGYLQQGRHKDAEQILSEMIGYCRQLPSPRARSHEIYLKSTYLAETDDWENPLLQGVTEDASLNISTRAMQANTMGRLAFKRNDRGTLDSLIGSLAQERLKIASTLNDQGITVCSSGASRSNASKLDVALAEVMELQLQFSLALLNGDPKEAENFLQKAEALEASLDYSYGPPAVPKPSAELYGDFLLSAGRISEAASWYEKSLLKAPKRVQSLIGLLNVARKTGNEKEELLLLEQLNDVYREADPGVYEAVAMN